MDSKFESPLVAHMKEMCKRTSCPMCEGEQWIFIPPIDTREVASIEKDEVEYIVEYTGGCWVFYPACCQSCGYTLLFNAEAVLAFGRDCKDE